ncbi:MAG: DUF721 domain-containing protein [Pirellulales bacterium]
MREEPTPEQIEAWELGQIKQQKSRLYARPIGSVMRRLMSERDYGAVESSQNLIDAWAAAVGPERVTNTHPVKVTKGVLQVDVADSSTLQEMHFDRLRLLKSLQAALPEFKITDIRFRVRAKRGS